jgi:hypothetical protein
MHSTKTTIRRLACTAGLALTAFAAFATGAASGSAASGNEALICNARAQDCMTDAEFRALMIRSVALNHTYGLGTSG